MNKSGGIRNGSYDEYSGDKLPRIAFVTANIWTRHFIFNVGYCFFSLQCVEPSIL